VGKSTNPSPAGSAARGSQITDSRVVVAVVAAVAPALPWSDLKIHHDVVDGAGRAGIDDGRRGPAVVNSACDGPGDIIVPTTTIESSADDTSFRTDGGNDEKAADDDDDDDDDRRCWTEEEEGGCRNGPDKAPGN
jgi:hypothetical protein